MDAKYLVHDTRPLKLHATILNTIYAKGLKSPPPPRGVKTKTPEAKNVADTTDGSPSKPAAADASADPKPKSRAPLKMDATDILERYKDYVWAEGVVLDRVAICEMGSKKLRNEKGEVVSEEYTVVASVPLRGRIDKGA